MAGESRPTTITETRFLLRAVAAVLSFSRDHVWGFCGGALWDIPGAFVLATKLALIPVCFNYFLVYSLHGQELEPTSALPPCSERRPEKNAALSHAVSPLPYRIVPLHPFRAPSRPIPPRTIPHLTGPHPTNERWNDTAQSKRRRWRRGLIIHRWRPCGAIIMNPPAVAAPSNRNTGGGGAVQSKHRRRRYGPMKTLAVAWSNQMAVAPARCNQNTGGERRCGIWADKRASGHTGGATTPTLMPSSLW